MKTLGIITTTYNRDYCIHQVYESLRKQQCKDFMWLVVDDGSDDNTKEIIQGYIAEGIIEIEYIYQENQGMTAARNTAYENIYTEICTIIDSDDWMEDGGVEKIINYWKAYGSESVAGIIALNRRTDGDLSARNLPQGIKQCTLFDLHEKYKCKGDKKLIYRTDIAKKYPYPRFEGEKVFPASYKFRLIDLDYEMLLMNDTVCIVDVNESGLSFDILNQYRKNPKGFSFYRNEMMRISNNPLYRIRQAIHYIASSKFSNDSQYIRNASKKLYVLLCLPLGLIFYMYLKKTKRKTFRDLKFGIFYK